jgi:hypothetical protein
MLCIHSFSAYSFNSFIKTKMKKLILCGLIALSAIAVTITSCNKYVDGPKLSLLTKKSRVCNTWVVEKFTETSASGSSTDLTSQFAGYVLEIKKDGTYTVTDGSFTDSGTWRLGEDKDDILMTSSAPNSTENGDRILRLKSKEFWVKHTYPNADYDEIHYKQK